MAIRLHDAQSSLHMLQNAPDINEKTMLLEKLRYKLEATMNPLLLKALQEQNFESVKNSYVIYAKIDCVDQFMTFYVNSRKAQIQKLWNELDHLHSKLPFIYLKIDILFLSNLFLISNNSQTC
jgi:hypothetical protein